jgi:hypothetical protein
MMNGPGPILAVPARVWCQSLNGSLIDKAKPSPVPPVAARCPATYQTREDSLSSVSPEIAELSSLKNCVK